MISILSKILIKKDEPAERVRALYGILCGAMGIFLNIILSLSKILAGLICGSIAILADGFNNLSDAAGSVATIIGFLLSEKKPDEDHPYGHGRMEYLAGFIIAMFIEATAVVLIKDSVLKIINPQDISFSWALVAVLLFSVLVKLYMAYYNYRVGKETDSPTLLANFTDSISDCVATSLVLLATLLEHFYGWHIDGVGGVVIGLLIAWAGINVYRDTINPLLGQPPKKEFVEEIEKITLSFNEKISGMHDLLVHDYGPGRRFITLHLELPADEDVLLLHEICDALEKELSLKLGCFATVHLDPVVNDERVVTMKEKMAGLTREFNDSFSIHDFRMVPGDNNTNLLFDVLVPINYNKKNEEIIKELLDFYRHRLEEGFSVIIQIDRNIGTI